MSFKIYRHHSGAQLEYEIYGEGQQTLICFHGFGEKLNRFEFISTYLPDYQIISVGLFFHGQSKLTTFQIPLQQKNWVSIFDDFLSELEIEKFSILGYSIGCRLGLYVLKSHQNRMISMLLLAPDCLKKSSYYVLATSPLTSFIFKYLMQNPDILVSASRYMERFNLIHIHLARFIRSQLKNKETAALVYQCWNAFKDLYQPKELIKSINHSHCNLTFIFGSEDKVVDPNRHQSLLSKLSETKIVIVPSRHPNLIDHSIDTIVSSL